MPAKEFKFRHGSGRTVTVKSILLDNGNLLVLQRTEADRTQVEWVEVKPGTSLFKRWWPVHVKEPDPRPSA